MTKDKATDKREKRARSIAAMGLVERDGGEFKVSTPSLRGKQTHYTVRRDEKNRIVCNCLEFEEAVINDAAFRCEHILAVKFSLVSKNVEQPNPEAEHAIEEEPEPVPDSPTVSETEPEQPEPEPMTFEEATANNKLKCDVVAEVVSKIAQSLTEMIEMVEASAKQRDDGERVTVSLGTQKFAPVQYMSFEVGAVHVSTCVKKGETIEAAGLRAGNEALKLQRQLFVFQRDEFWNNLKNMHEPKPANAYGDRAKEANHGVGFEDDSPY